MKTFLIILTILLALPWTVSAWVPHANHGRDDKVVTREIGNPLWLDTMGARWDCEDKVDSLTALIDNLRDMVKHRSYQAALHYTAKKYTREIRTVCDTTISGYSCYNYPDYDSTITHYWVDCYSDTVYKEVMPSDK